MCKGTADPYLCTTYKYSYIYMHASAEALWSVIRGGGKKKKLLEQTGISGERSELYIGTREEC